MYVNRKAHIEFKAHAIHWLVHILMSLVSRNYFCVDVGMFVSWVCMPQGYI